MDGWVGKWLGRWLIKEWMGEWGYINEWVSRLMDEVGR